MGTEQLADILVRTLEFQRRLISPDSLGLLGAFFEETLHETHRVASTIAMELKTRAEQGDEIAGRLVDQLMHGRYVVVRGEDVVDEWPIAARGY